MWKKSFSEVPRETEGESDWENISGNQALTLKHKVTPDESEAGGGLRIPTALAKARQLIFRPA